MSLAWNGTFDPSWAKQLIMSQKTVDDCDDDDDDDDNNNNGIIFIFLYLGLPIAE